MWGRCGGDMGLLARLEHRGNLRGLLLLDREHLLGAVLRLALYPLLLGLVLGLHLGELLLHALLHVEHLLQLAWGGGGGGWGLGRGLELG